MKWYRRIALTCCFCAVAAEGQSLVTVGYQKTIQVPVTGATAAYSLDSYIAEAAAANGVVAITGKSPGTTNIMVVTSGGVQSLQVFVPVPPSSLPPGFLAPTGEGGASESGFYEVRYNSDPGQLTNSITMRRSQGDSFERLQLTNSNLFSASSASSTSRIGFPLASYEIGRKNWDMVFLDQTVYNSPLTLDGSLVRGFHVREGDWQFHGGFTTIATFQGLFLVTDPEKTIGISRRIRFNKEHSLTGNLYYFKNPSSQSSVTPDGAVGSLVYGYKHLDKANLLTELGVSRRVAVAVRGNFDDKKTHVTGDFRFEPQRFPSLAISNQRGIFGSVNASRTLNDRWYTSLDVNQSNYSLPQLKQSNFASNLLLNYKLSQRFTLTGGSAFSRFASQIPVAPTVNSFNAPLGIDYARTHFGAGFQYQRTVIFDGSGGNDYGVNARGSWRRFQVNGYFRHDAQVPTLSLIFSQLPGLQELLDRAGIIVTNPDQLAQLLRDSSLLATLGFSTPFSVNLAPSRNDSGASFTWTSPGVSRRQLNVSYFNSDTTLIQGSLKFSTVTVSYSQHLGGNNDIVLSGSMFRTITNGTSSVQPLIGISLQHRFSTVPSFLLPGRHGTIQGHVFRDDESAGRYNGKQVAVSGIEIRLDDTRVTHSDGNGYYSFHHVPFGSHRVEAKYQSQDQFFFTTDSPATVDMNATADFGINFAKGQLYGFVLNDAGTGVPGVTVELQGTTPPRTAQTTSDGKFSFLGLGPGTYSVSTAPASYPIGYSLQNLQTLEATVESGKPARVEMRVKAIRAISGKVTVYDTKLLQEVPLTNITVSLKELSLTTKTGSNGAYLFRNLPTGTYTLSITYEGKESSRTVIVPPEPANIRDADIKASPKEEPKAAPKQ